MKILKIVMFAMTMLVTQLAGFGHGAGYWTNEPDGFTTRLDCTMANLAACGISNPYNAGTIVSSETSDPVSPPSAYRSRIEAGSNTGGTQLNWSMPIAREMYVGTVVRTNEWFEGRPQGNKMFFMRGPWTNGAVNTFNSVFLFNNQSLSGGSGSVIWGHNTGGGLDNSHACSFDFGLACLPNVGSGTMTVGTLTKLEAYIKCSSSPTARDGIVRWWVNGSPAGNYTNINYCSDGLNEWAWSETWDGTPNFTVTTAWEWYQMHVHISTGTATGGGGSDTVPGRPGQVTGLSVSVF